jgi:uncharacterized protein with LGFP repeats
MGVILRPIGRTLAVSLSTLGMSLALVAPATAQTNPEPVPATPEPTAASSPSSSPTDVAGQITEPETITPTTTPKPGYPSDSDVFGSESIESSPAPGGESPVATPTHDTRVHGEEAEAAQTLASPNWVRYGALGGAARLGEPIGPELVGSSGARMLQFANAALISGPNTTPRLLEGSILGRYLEIGGLDSVIGLPITDEVAGGRGSRAVLFERGRIYSSPATGTHEVYGAILQRYLALNAEHGTLGLPTTSEVSGGANTRIQSFQGGRMYWTAPFGAHEVYGAILVKYDRIGAENSPLGPPKTGEVSGPAGTRMNQFKGGHIYHGGTGTHEVFGAILMRYLAEGGPAGQLGLPTSGEEGWDYGRISRFQYGTITWNSVNGETRTNYSVNPAFLIHPRTGAPFNANVARWAPTVIRALSDNGLPTYYTPGVLAQIQQESGGNPNAVNVWDINWQNGYASFGLLQTIAPTYQSFAPPGQRGVITWRNVNGRNQQFVPEMVVPYNNIFAGINYAKTRYGLSRLNAWNSGYNYAYGQDVIPEALELSAED